MQSLHAGFSQIILLMRQAAGAQQLDHRMQVPSLCCTVPLFVRALQRTVCSLCRLCNRLRQCQCSKAASEGRTCVSEASMLRHSV